jgi:hypothetical protein
VLAGESAGDRGDFLGGLHTSGRRRCSCPSDRRRYYRFRGLLSPVGYSLFCHLRSWRTASVRPAPHLGAIKRYTKTRLSYVGGNGRVRAPLGRYKITLSRCLSCYGGLRISRWSWFASFAKYNMLTFLSTWNSPSRSLERSRIRARSQCLAGCTRPRGPGFVQPQVSQPDRTSSARLAQR